MPVMVTTCHRGDEPDATPLSFLAPGPGFAHCFAGSGFQADELLASLRALGPVNDTITSVPMSAISHLHMDPSIQCRMQARGCCWLTCPRLP